MGDESDGRWEMRVTGGGGGGGDEMRVMGGGESGL